MGLYAKRAPEANNIVLAGHSRAKVARVLLMSAVTFPRRITVPCLLRHRRISCTSTSG